MKNYPEPTDYIAGVYRAETHAPECDHYVWSEDLLRLGIRTQQTKRPGDQWQTNVEVIVPFDVDRFIRSMNAKMVFTISGLTGEPILCLSAAECAQALITQYDYPVENSPDDLLSWMKANLSEPPKLIKTHDERWLRFANSEDFVLFRLKWEGVA